MFDGIPYDIVGVGSPALSTYIVNSDNLRYKLVESFKNAIDKGYHPDDVKGQIFNAFNATTDDLTELDKTRLVEEVMDYYEEVNS